VVVVVVVFVVMLLFRMVSKKNATTKKNCLVFSQQHTRCTPHAEQALHATPTTKQQK
jgi:hypothetical protein